MVPAAGGDLLTYFFLAAFAFVGVLVAFTGDLFTDLVLPAPLDFLAVPDTPRPDAAGLAGMALAAMPLLLAVLLPVDFAFLPDCFVAWLAPVVLVATGEDCLAGAAFLGDAFFAEEAPAVLFFEGATLLTAFFAVFFTLPLLAAGAFFLVGLGLMVLTGLSGLAVGRFRPIKEDTAGEVKHFVSGSPCATRLFGSAIKKALCHQGLSCRRRLQGLR